MAQIKFLRGTSELITTASVVDGQILVATDKGQLFVDAGSARVQINDIIKVATLPEASAANVNKVYYATTPNVLAVSNGTAWTQINAQQVIAEGSTAGTISVGGVDVPVHGLGSAAYENTDAFDAAGAAAAVLGTSADVAGTNTVYGVKADAAAASAAAAAAQEAADAAMEAAETAQAGADGSVKSITAADASITVNASTATAPTIKVAISADEGNALSLEDDGLKVTIGAAPEYSVVKAETATEGYAATYHLTKDGVNTGAAIDIPKDYLVKSATLKESTGEDDPSGLPAGTKYIDFVVNTADTTGTESHIYLNVNDLVDVYTAGNGITIDGSNVVSANVVTGNGLSVSEAGIAMAVASGEAAGAMSATDKTKLDGIAAGAEVNYVKSVSAPFSVSGAGALSASEATISAAGLMSAADKAHLDAIVAGGEGYITSVAAPLNVSEEGELSIGAASGSAAGTMSAADFTKLAGVAEGAEVNVIDAITFNGSAVNVAGKTAAITLEWTDLA